MNAVNVERGMILMQTVGAERLASFIKAHGVACEIVGAGVLCFGLFTCDAGRSSGYEVEIIRTMSEARAFLGY